ncbi:hypothetical protein P168DRAFT_256873 [Aspergillus campestris IBT 28561]|uniref:tRNA(Phe) 7-[(3-amino-3-carboxypropyl)-4-demethylwyosine(37)-N(4)]-methyltransferase n=1 Tax=Aspergillus campestris (strain IBT 28561) TaxID=1392248 RepID=A0A2I1CWD4_ASPC2|nr:uncharacterized protein P168DRAFT_256873 [Aspergillus campestris IBT 28561]PKY01931.1 hypothetical protein P168DRAFT_256873 [Aspergillus campestris IBT 28561]
MSGVQPANADAPIPSIFESRKRKILAELSVPDAEYTDLSPKGSVDVAIRDLIREINDVPGLVTTSSCAGRISVFLEGRKKVKQTQQQQLQQQTQEEGEAGGQARQFVPSGGKGAGRWLFVSHDPLLEGEESEGRWRGEAGSFSSLHELFGMVKGDGRPPRVGGDGSGKGGRAPRLVRFHYDPMILHIMTATLNHANPVLSAASSAGFRESGLQGLRCLEGEDGPSPIVAVRSAGLSLESVIGYCEDDGDDGDDDSQPVVRSLVTEEYLEMLIAISNERFAVNDERKERFRASLSKAYSVSGPGGTKSKGKAKPPGWEDPEARRKRMREEGLMRKKLLDSQGEAERTSRDGEDDSIDS